MIWLRKPCVSGFRNHVTREHLWVAIYRKSPLKIERKNQRRIDAVLNTLNSSEYSRFCDAQQGTAMTGNGERIPTLSAKILDTSAFGMF